MWLFNSNCKDGELVCTGDPCLPNCSDDEFMCNDGHCLNNILKCNGEPECRDGADEFGCEGTDYKIAYILF